MPEPADTARNRLAYEARRRREALTVLQIAEATCRYGASVLADGAGPAEARAAVVEVAGELAVVAEALRKVVGPGPAERRVLAVRLLAVGMSKHQVAVRLGVSDRTVRGYVAAGRPRPVNFGGDSTAGDS